MSQSQENLHDFATSRQAKFRLGCPMDPCAEQRLPRQRHCSRLRLVPCYQYRNNPTTKIIQNNPKRIQRSTVLMYKPHLSAFSLYTFATRCLGTRHLSPILRASYFCYLHCVPCKHDTVRPQRRSPTLRDAEIRWLRPGNALEVADAKIPSFHYTGK